MTAPSPTFPLPPEGLHQRRAWIWRALAQAYFKLSGWQVVGHYPKAPKCVAIVAPHTSNWDFPLGVCLLFGSGLRASWLGKHTIFKGPWGPFLRRLGGIPVDRSAPQGLVGECVRAFETAPALMIALAPEGTRKGISRWRTGFYQIAVGAGVPILPVAFDFREHRIHLLDPFTPTGDAEADVERLKTILGFAQGLRPRPTA